MDVCPHWNPDNITDNLMGRMIYKDECAKCFALPTDDSGLDVCLRCFVGSCRPKDGPENENHSMVHFKHTEHPLTMNIRKVKKQDINEPTKVTKLAIGKPGGIDADTDNYDTVVHVFCHSC